MSLILGRIAAPIVAGRLIQSSSHAIIQGVLVYEVFLYPLLVRLKPRMWYLGHCRLDRLHTILNSAPRMAVAISPHSPVPLAKAAGGSTLLLA